MTPCDRAALTIRICDPTFPDCSYDNPAVKSDAPITTLKQQKVSFFVADRCLYWVATWMLGLLVACQS